MQNTTVSTGPYQPVATITGTSTIVPTEFALFNVDATNGPFTVTLPPAAGCVGLPVTIKAITSTGNLVTLQGSGSDLIEGASSITLGPAGTYPGVTLVSDDAAWRITGLHGTPSAVVSGSPLDSGVHLYAPYHLRRWRAYMSDALFARVPIVCAGDSITFGQGSDGNNSANNTPDNTQGWVGQLRSLLAASPQSGAVNPGEGFLFNTDTRVTTTGAQTGANAYSGPLRHSTRLLSGQTLSITIPTGAGGTLQVIQANNSGDSTGSYTVNAGGSTGLTALTGTGTSIVTSITVNAGDAIVISGPASAQTYITGVVLQSGTTGIPVHRVGIAGYVTGDALGGQTAGTLNLTSGQQTSAIKKLYDWAGGPGLLILSFGANDQSFQAGGGTTAQNGVTLSLYTSWTQQIVNQAITDGWDVLLLGEPPNPTAPSIAGGQESDYRAALKSIALATDHCAYLNVIDLWSTGTLAQGRGLQLTNSVHPTRKGHGDMARLVHQAVTQAFGENSSVA